ncbi:hypothetical protein ACFSKI_01580 [Pseudogracilibacillus auburnensis]|uniref:Uncharacterized protein n=1 Tax=Pseudogracilibacillus auburnensis TaxID=1494959 RepID=A0A2V3VIA0_9BACI|nr:hypothetical protein [Pseudogracilibacillus auburnensis]PXW80934.1 hypothetical protein DFR56_12443 [Pseudogracilibacillus auburnensis]
MDVEKVLAIIVLAVTAIKGITSSAKDVSNIVVEQKELKKKEAQENKKPSPEKEDS